MAKYFNNNLKYIRQERKMSQQELANKIGADRSTISRWENNEIETPLDMAIKIADVFNIPYHDFFWNVLKFDNAEVIDVNFDIIEKIANQCGYKIYFENEKNGERFQSKEIRRKDT